MQRKLAALVLPLASLMLGVAAPATAGFVNGSFEQYAGGSNNAPSQLGNSGTGYSVLTGWTVGSGTYGFLMAAGAGDTTGSYSPEFSNTFTLWGKNNNGANTLPATSPDKGNYVVLDAASGYRGTGISQTITGLVAGQKYVVGFDWATGQQHGYDGMTNESLQVSFAGQTLSTASLTTASHGFNDWQQQSFVFTADGTSDTLNFLAMSTSPSGVPPMVLLDGVTFSAVPEPGSLALLGVGIVVTAAVRRCRRATPAPM